jgi:hypothetical protein
MNMDFGGPGLRTVCGTQRYDGVGTSAHPTGIEDYLNNWDSLLSVVVFILVADPIRMDPMLTRPPPL